MLLAIAGQTVDRSTIQSVTLLACCCTIQGSIFTLKAAKTVLPYMTVAAVHWFLVAYWHRWPAYRDSAGRVAEVQLACPFFSGLRPSV